MTDPFMLNCPIAEATMLCEAIARLRGQHKRETEEERALRTLLRGLKPKLPAEVQAALKEKGYQ